MANLSITAASVARGTGSQVSSGTADVAITQGQSVYLDTTTQTIKLADADALASASINVGVSLNAAATGQPVTYQTVGPITIGATVTVGTAYYVSATAGSICLESDLSSGDFPLLLGFATSTTVINLQPFAARVAKA
jgi:hypothetical protein